MTLRETLITQYLDYVNDWLTIESWAEHHHMSREAGEIALKLGREFHLADTGAPNLPLWCNPHL